MHVVYETLRELGVTDKVMVTVFNKIDAALPDTTLKDFSSDFQVRISARTGEGIDELENLLETILRSRRIYLEKVYSYKDAGKIQQIRKYGQLLKEEYLEDGILVNAYVPAELFAGLAENREFIDE